MSAILIRTTGLSFVALLSLSFDVFAGPYCGMAVQKSPGLYVATCGNSPSCLWRVIEGGDSAYLLDRNGIPRQLGRGRKTFVFKSDADLPVNSLVVVQIKRTDQVLDRAKPVDVRVRRQPFSFGCRGRTVDSFPDSDPEATAEGYSSRSFNFSKYDEYHRKGFTTEPEDGQLFGGFHTNYNNGTSCVSTSEPWRRSQFLIEDQENYAGYFRGWTSRFGLHVPVISEDGMKRARNYSDISVVLTNYTQRATAPGCFSFSTAISKATKRLQLSLRDLEGPSQHLIYIPITVSFDLSTSK